MEPAQIFTVVFIAVVAVVAIAVDIALLLNKTRRDTISEIIAQGAQWSYSIPYLWGILGGHFFGPRHLPPLGVVWSPIILAITAALLEAIGHGLRTSGQNSRLDQLLVLILGIFMGWVFFPLP